MLSACGDDETIYDEDDGNSDTEITTPGDDSDDSDADEDEPGSPSGTLMTGIRFTADWSEALFEESIPTLYNIGVNGNFNTASTQSEYIYSDSIAEADYEILAYNEPEGISFSDGLAYTDTDADGLLVSPCYLFAADTVASAVAGDTTDITLRMRRLVVPLCLILKFSEAAEVKDAEATLGNVVPSIIFPEGTYEGEPSVARFNVKLLPDNMGVCFWLRALGFYPEYGLPVELGITLSDGHKLSYTSDIAKYVDGLKPVCLKVELDTSDSGDDDGDDPEPSPGPWYPPGGGGGSSDDDDVSADISAVIDGWEETEIEIGVAK